MGAEPYNIDTTRHKYSKAKKFAGGLYYPIVHLYRTVYMYLNITNGQFNSQYLWLLQKWPIISIGGSNYLKQQQGLYEH